MENKTQSPQLNILAVISRFFKPKYWVVKKCGFPYSQGYATYNWKKKMFLDTGLSKEEAKAICRELNGL
jgi:hypothetical protein